MKVAVIIGGLSRNYKNIYSSFSKMLSGMDSDIFIFTWDMFSDTNDASIGLQALTDMYNPTKIVMESYDAFSKFIHDRITHFTTIQAKRNGYGALKTSLMAQHYTIKGAYSLIDAPDEYDIIIRYRFDWCPTFVINWEDVLNKSQKAVLYSNQKVNGLRGTKWLINDLFIVSNPKYMKVCCSLFDAMMTDVYLEDIRRVKCFIPEYILALHLIKNNIPLEGYNFPYKPLRSFKNRRVNERI